MKRILVASALAALAALPVLAEGFQRIDSKQGFLSLIDDRKLKRLGVTLDVSPQGDIQGRAFGRQVTGDWRWENGYFCRTLNWGERALEPNCQLVELKGNTLRFTSDQGAGEFADLRLN